LNNVLGLLNKSSSFAEVSILRKQLLDLIATKEKETACIKKQFHNPKYPESGYIILNPE